MPKGCCNMLTHPNPEEYANLHTVCNTYSISNITYIFFHWSFMPESRLGTSPWFKKSDTPSGMPWRGSCVKQIYHRHRKKLMQLITC